MQMTANETLPTWRNTMTWAAVGFLLCSLVMLGAISLLQEGGLGAVFARDTVAVRKAVASLTGALILASAVTGFAKRNSRISRETVRNFLVTNVLAIAIFALALWSYEALTGSLPPGAASLSAKVALILGLVLVGLAVLCSLMVAAAHSRGGFLPPEQAEDIRELSRVTIYAAVWMAATGLTLVVLSLVGPGGPISPAIGLAGAVVLLGIASAVTFAMWPLLDELSQTLSRESGNAGFYLVTIIGGGWAVLAHLGFVQAPAPLDWLTMFVLTSFAASFIAIGRRNLLGPR